MSCAEINFDEIAMQVSTTILSTAPSAVFVQRKTVGTDDGGGVSETWARVSETPTKCFWNVKDGMEQIVNSRWTQKTEVVFTLPFGVDVTVSDRLELERDNRIFEISSIAENNKTVLKIKSTQIN